MSCVKVRYYGHVGQMTGYGKAAEAMCMAFLTAGCELEIRPLSPFEKVVIDRDLPLARCLRRDYELTPPDVVIVHTLPLDCAHVAHHAQLALLDVPLIAYTTWEGGEVPQDVLGAGLACFDQVWVPSSVTAERVEYTMLTMSTPSIVKVMPHAFDEATLEARRKERAGDDRDRRFAFYYVGAWTARKNPEGVVRAFTRAFDRRDEVVLLLQCANASEVDYALALHRTGFTRDDAAIRFMSKPASDQDIVNLHIDADCFVTATRGESWNLPCFEAVLAGRMVISTKGIGSDDYLTPTNALAVAGTPQPAGGDARTVSNKDGQLHLSVVGAQGMTTKTTWIEPDLVQMARHMRTVYETKQRWLAPGSYHYDLVATYGYKAVGARARKLLEEL